MDFYEAFHFLYEHDMFKGKFWESLYVEVVKVDPETNCVENERSRNTKTQIWLETGPYFEEDAVAVLIPNATVYMPFSDLVDVEKEIERLKSEEKKLEGELKRVNGMLNNEKFISKAPEAKIQEEKDKLAKYTTMMEQVKERLKHLEK